MVGYCREAVVHVGGMQHSREWPPMMQILAGTSKFGLDPTRMVSLEIANESNAKRVGGTLGWGLAGAAVLGPLGLIAGLVAGGKDTDITFVATYEDGSSILGKADRKSFEKLRAQAFDSIRWRSAAAVQPTPDPVLPPVQKSYSAADIPASLQEEVDRVEWLLTKCGWRVRRQEKVRGVRYEVLLAINESGEKRAVACTSDALTPYAFERLASGLEQFTNDAECIVVGRNVSDQTRAVAKQASIAVADAESLLAVMSQAGRSAFRF